MTVESPEGAAPRVSLTGPYDERVFAQHAGRRFLPAFSAFISEPGQWSEPSLACTQAVTRFVNQMEVFFDPVFSQMFAPFDASPFE
jgi:hypothetical protein